MTTTSESDPRIVTTTAATNWERFVRSNPAASEALDYVALAGTDRALVYATLAVAFETWRSHR